MIIPGERKLQKKAVTTKVKNGKFAQVKEFKLLGTWLDESGCYFINLAKFEGKMQHMIEWVKVIGSEKNVGQLGTVTWLKLMEAEDKQSNT